MKWNVQRKILSGFISVLILLLVLAGISYSQLLTVNKTYSNLLDEQVEKVSMAKELDLLFQRQSASIRGYIITNNSDYYNQYQEARSLYLNTSKKIKKLIASSKGKQLYEQIDSLDNQYFDAVDLEVKLFKEHNQAELNKFITNDLKGISENFTASVDALVDHQQKQLDKTHNQVREKVNNIKVFIIVITIFALLVGIVIALVIGRMISRPIKNVSGIMKLVSEGDLRIDPVKVRSEDEIGELARSFNQMVEDLALVVRQVSDSSMQVASSSEQLTASAQQSAGAAEQVTRVITENANGTEKQLETFYEVNGAVDEMAEGMNQIARASEEMLHSSEETSTLSEQGVASITKVVAQMNEIHTTVEEATNMIHSLGRHSEDIRKITEIITGIANQTNLLALNAAIEAARAGEHGKGFAVVADEVRILAEESRKSSDQISAMIEQIQAETKKTVISMEAGNNKVEQGLAFSNEANESFFKISQSISTVANRAEHVSSSIESIQNITLKVAKAMEGAKKISEQVANGSQENASASEEQLATMGEIASSAESLSHLAEELQMVISKFKLTQQ
ncbi:methyl-accepting chemotaxis protein [Heyndrickxia oleronia]|uniref:methyl-accepting chemotaxis protein n=1 Tax=Heyndrickxia oleronia TaxID=38875 RepID=UPI00242E88BE|nr:methyl-accepting chemotaxis protein [Heyndrickxia oleronia]MCI1593367.1 methyl-accepting chemotaxis protein [Heyndrickxia oleronia]MCI1615880.1 methyl-accepting chemotaxis protein [Heyndrickxia oleronia]MCI1746464.1 methyl-accepting chemotaxis protein [Heyndrickxia oleronia]MCI1764272.1 methyl-accepting chemotaxis protein [Heyndrickxia oleronia]